MITGLVRGTSRPPQALIDAGYRSYAYQAAVADTWPAPGEFDPTSLERELAWARERGQVVRFRPFFGCVDPRDRRNRAKTGYPAWLGEEAGTYLYDEVFDTADDDTRPVCRWWDDSYLGRLGQYLGALAEWSSSAEAQGLAEVQIGATAVYYAEPMIKGAASWENRQAAIKAGATASRVANAERSALIMHTPLANAGVGLYLPLSPYQHLDAPRSIETTFELASFAREVLSDAVTLGNNSIAGNPSKHQLYDQLYDWLEQQGRIGFQLEAPRKWILRGEHTRLGVEHAIARGAHSLETHSSELAGREFLSFTVDELADIDARLRANAPAPSPVRPIGDGVRGPLISPPTDPVPVNPVPADPVPADPVSSVAESLRSLAAQVVRVADALDGVQV